MKNLVIVILSIFLITCSNSDDTTTVPVIDNKVLLLRVDFTTTNLEGAKELTFDSNIENFTIVSDYQAPGDFGNIKLVYEQLEEVIFDGSIIWMGTGEMAFPDSFTNAEDLDIIDEPLEMPANSLFQNVMYDEFAYYPEDMDYALIWDAIDNLQVVSEYRTSNPEATINVFLYTPSVGVGNPLEWDYFIILKN